MEDTRSGGLVTPGANRVLAEVIHMHTRVLGERRFRPDGIDGRFADALAYATQAHAGQVRRGDGRPYVAHLLRVSGLVIQEGGWEDAAIAALLHDAVEDQGGLERLADIRARYGDAVAGMVDECTDSYGEPRPPWRRRKEAYLAELQGCSPGGLLVSLADKVDNARTLLRGRRLHGAGFWQRSGKRPGEVRWYYGELVSRFAELRPGPLADELTSAVADLDGLIADDLGEQAG
jgi:(p)ppGpp synthase/HD superfamily hydrolase